MIFKEKHCQKLRRFNEPETWTVPEKAKSVQHGVAVDKEECERLAPIFNFLALVKFSIEHFNFYKSRSRTHEFRW